ncbi:MAG TPA: beta-ketoacyl-[acyl-carrier-protein] synthase family protein [Burkholderiales bacterium]|nr:beta-ketoacyl-[acyl-carrier-protein] synthase family protein [Burkholderiales bacterium]
MAIASGAAIGSGATVIALRERRTGLAPCAFETAQLQTCAGQVTDARLVPVRADLAEFDCRNNRLAQLGLTLDGFEETVLQARERYGAARIGVFLGTSTSGIHSTELAYRRRDERTGALPADFHYRATHNTYSVAWFVQTYLGLRGPSLVVSTACSSSAKVFGTAARMIAADLCDAAVVGGVDSLCLTTLYGFGSLGLLSAGYCRPFDRERDGISIGEGAGFVLLEKPAANSAAQVALLGVGESSDAYHMSSPHPDGLGARLAMESALRDAGLAPGAIDYINLHGTGTPANDTMEDKAVVDLFGRQTRCSSTKGWTGHTLGACGAIEAIIAALAIENGFLPGSVNTRELDPAMRLRYLIENAPVPAHRVMSNAFGFGGTNCSLVLGRA